MYEALDAAHDDLDHDLSKFRFHFRCTPGPGPGPGAKASCMKYVLEWFLFLSQVRKLILNTTRWAIHSSNFKATSSLRGLPRDRFTAGESRGGPHGFCCTGPWNPGTRAPEPGPRALIGYDSSGLFHIQPQVKLFTSRSQPRPPWAPPGPGAGARAPGPGAGPRPPGPVPRATNPGTPAPGRIKT